MKHVMSPKRDQMALVVRFVDKDGIVLERFFDCIHVTSIKALTLKQELSCVLSSHSVSLASEGILCW